MVSLFMTRSEEFLKSEQSTIAKTNYYDCRRKSIGCPKYYPLLFWRASNC